MRRLILSGAIAGALRPNSVNEDWFRVVSAIEQGSLVDVAQSLASRWPRGEGHRS